MEFENEEEEKHIRELEPIPKLTTRKKSHVLAIPDDKSLILKMLLRPEEYGHKPHDYSCAGDNWIVNDELVPRQSPIDI